MRESAQNVVTRALEVARLALVTLAVASLSWTLSSTWSPPSGAAANAADPVGRAAPLDRGLAPGSLRAPVVRHLPPAEPAAAVLAFAEPAPPAATPPPAPVRLPVGARPAVAEVERIIREAAERWGADPDQLMRVAWCESRLNAHAYNPSHGDSGVFQFIPGTWARNAPRAGYAGASPFDAVANANTAALLFREGKAWMWTCK